MVARWRSAAGTTIVAAMRRVLLLVVLASGCARNGDPLFKKLPDAALDAFVAPRPDANVPLPDASVDASVDAKVDAMVDAP
jgi:hypothetical protein